MTAFDELKQLTEGLFAHGAIERHPLFLRIESGQLSAAQLRAVGLQIHHVVIHFPRFLAALLSNLPDHRLRMCLAENLFEEHGRMNPQAVHVETHAVFLGSLGVTVDQISASRPLVPVIAYNRAVTDLCLHHPFPEGLGALGVIEETVARASVVVSRFAAQHLGGTKGPVAHFGEHKMLDLRHSDEIYEVASKFLEGHSRPLVEQGLALGMYYHRRLYTDLLEAIARVEA